jgi:hypothetical protein
MLLYLITLTLSHVLLAIRIPAILSTANARKSPGPDQMFREGNGPKYQNPATIDPASSAQERRI